MQSVHAKMWDPPSKPQHAPPLSPPHPPQTRPSHVSAPQAKRITFYKSGDSQFGGVKMAVHKRSFKCFDALLDDLSQKVPLPFGVRTVTTPRGTHTIHHLEQLQDGGCYLCSDRRYVKPINMDLAAKQSSAWSHRGSRRPHRPDSTADTPPGHVPYRQRRLLLVKNTEPGMRRTVVLSRRVTRSLRAFLEEASDVMQFHVRKLYTVEGRKIDNVQSLMTCPNVLVCVGREDFSPLLVNYVRKSSDEKLPGVSPRTPGNGARTSPQGAHSRASERSEGQDSKKNAVNFGLETKKSIIHPRSDSSARSGRFSMSSEKSYGLSTLSQGRAAFLDDDIEKRVVVNKDGSLSVEMKVRFRLQNDETLQWSTQIKKAASMTNDSCFVSQGQTQELQNEICSDPDCNLYENENGEYSSQCAMDANTCTCCFEEDTQYDLWKNPVHCHKQANPSCHSTTESHTILRHTHSSSSSSSCNSTRVVRCRARLTNCEDGTERSEIVQEEMSVTEQHLVEKDISVVSRCCSRSEVVVNGEELSSLCSKGGNENERPMSAISNSSHVLQELKDYEDELPPSASRCGEANLDTLEGENDDKTVCDTNQNSDLNEEESVCQCQTTDEVNGCTSTSKSRPSSCKSNKEIANDEVEEIKTVVSGLSAGSQQSATSLCPDCGGWTVKNAFSCNSRSTNKSPKADNPSEDEDDGSLDVSTLSNASNVTSSRETTNGECREASAMSINQEQDVDETRAASVTSRKSCSSRSLSVKSDKLENPPQEERVASAMSAKSKSSVKTNNSQKSSIKVTAPTEEVEELRPGSDRGSPSVKSESSNCDNSVNKENPDVDNNLERVASSMSSKSSISAKTHTSHKSSIKVTAPTEEEEETRSPSVLSEKSNTTSKKSRPASSRSTKTDDDKRPGSVLSVKSNGNTSRPSSAESQKCQNQNAEEDIKAARVKSDESRSASPVSVKSSKSEEIERGNLEVTCNGKESRPGSVLSVKSVKSEASKKSEATKDQTRASSVLSVKSNASAKSAKSHLSEKSTQNEAQNMEEMTEKSSKESRPPSAISVKSSKSGKSKNKNVEEDSRAASATSFKSKASNKAEPISTTSLTNVDKEKEERGESALSNKSRKSNKPECREIVQNGEEKQEERPTSAMSSKSALSVKSSKTNNSVNIVSPAKEENGRPVSTTSGKTHVSSVSTKSKTSNQTVISTKVKEENDNTSERVTSPLSVKSSKSSRFQVVTIKTPDVISSKQNRITDANESLEEAAKSSNSICPQELTTENGDRRGPSSLSVHSCKSTKSKCSCEKSNKATDDKGEDSEVGANISSAKGEDLDEEDSFASVSLVLPEDQESESGESHISQRNKSKTLSPEVDKGALNADNADQNISKTNNIPTIETPGHSSSVKEVNDENIRRASSCSTKSTRSVRSTKSKKSCSNCGTLTTQVDDNGVASPVASVKSNVTTKTGQLAAPDNRTTSAMSTASARSHKKVDKDNNCSSESEKKDDKLASAKTKSPSTSRPKSVHSTSSRSCKNKTENAISPQNGSRPASKADTCSESILSHSLSAADLIKEVKAAEIPERPRSKMSKTSAKSQKGEKEVEPALTPSCLPNASPNEVVSEWLNSIPANMLLLADEEGDKCVEGIETEVNTVDLKAEESEKEEIKEVEEEGKKVETFEIKPIAMLTESSLPQSWQSSTAVMKVLLRSSLGRCQSMPEVSPVFGRRLSASAKELLDCLAQLQLIEPANQGFSMQKDQRPQFEDIISILQSLWLAEPKDTKDSSSTEQVSPPRSSSGVGMSSGSGGSGKDNANTSDEPRPGEQADDKTESPKENENSSSLERNPKTPTDNDLDTHEGSCPDSPPAAPQAALSKYQSQDPDPMWVLSLLKKLEKQFMNHYVTAMDDFKVKWDLEDSLILDRMITELRDEVSQRIEKSVEREMKKIQSRAGKVTRVPRPPPGSHQSTDSTVDKRRRLLKVMKNHSVKTGDSMSDGELTGDNSDQRSDDEYCPCEACIAKKMAARPVKTNPNAAKAPVQMEFDLLKILQFKTAPATKKPEVKEEEAKTISEEEARNLEVVEEEEEEVSEDANIKENAKCNCQSSRDEDSETEDSDRETVKEKHSHKDETMEQLSEGEEGKKTEKSSVEEKGVIEGGDREEASTEEKASEQESKPAVSATEGEDADVEDSGTEGKSDERADLEGETTCMPEIRTESTVESSLLHQYTRTSVESQPGSLEDIEPCSSTNNIDVPKLASPGGTPQRRMRSPARVKRRKAINSDSDLDNV